MRHLHADSSAAIQDTYTAKLTFIAHEVGKDSSAARDERRLDLLLQRSDRLGDLVG